jgi:CheY-like chemotaxis protein
MNILVLDDDLDRHYTFARVFADAKHQSVHVQTVAKCIEALKETKFDLVYLDRDLSDFCDENKVVGMYGTQEFTGEDVANWMAKELPEERRPKEVVVHSWNQPGAARMILTLRDAGFNVRYKCFNPKTLRLDYL